MLLTLHGVGRGRTVRKASYWVLHHYANYNHRAWHVPFSVTRSGCNRTYHKQVNKTKWLNDDDLKISNYLQSAFQVLLAIFFRRLLLIHHYSILNHLPDASYRLLFPNSWYLKNGCCWISSFYASQPSDKPRILNSGINLADICS